MIWRQARKLKHPDHVNASWTELPLGEDEYGRWAVLPAGVPIHRESGTVLRYRSPQLFCYPRDGWWVARFGGPDAVFDAHRSDGSTVGVADAEPDRVDIATPAEISGGGISFIDLTLDLVRARDGAVTILDADEVEEEAARWSIPPAYLAQARRSCAKVAAMMEAGSAPFDDTPGRWLAAYARAAHDDHETSS